MSTQNDPAGCSLCGKPRTPRFAPFCGQRCADLDLGRWLKGGYAIPGTVAEDETGAPPAPDPSRDPQDD